MRKRQGKVLGNHAEGRVAGYNDHFLRQHGMQYVGSGLEHRCYTSKESCVLPPGPY